MRDAALLGFVIEKEANQHIGDETLARSRDTSLGVILSYSSKPDNLGFQALSAPVDIVSGN